MRLALLAIIAAILPPFPAAARVPDGAPLYFQGTLVALTRHTVEVLQDNSIVIAALLPASPQALTAGQLARHRVGDRVEITVRPIKGAFDALTRRDYFLELEALQAQGAADAAQLRAALDSRARLQPGNLLLSPPGAAATPPMPQPNALPKATIAAMQQWLQQFPNYSADASEKYTEGVTTLRAQEPSAVTLQYAATVADGHLARSAIRIHGAAWPGAYATTPVYHWQGGFGYVDAFVRPECNLRVANGSDLDKGLAEPADEFSFASAANGCLGDLYIGYQTVFTPVHGKLWIARGDHLPRRLEMTYEFPSQFPLRSMAISVNWTPVMAAQKRFVLPSSATVKMSAENGWRRSSVRYTNYQRFTVTSGIQVLGVVRNAPAVPDLTGRWIAIMAPGQQPAVQFALAISRDPQGKLTAWFIGSEGEERGQLEVNGSAVSFTTPTVNGAPVEFHGTLYPAGDTMDGTVSIAGQNLKAELRRQPVRQ